MHEGTINRIIFDKGYGFIRHPGLRGRDLFFHCKDLRGRLVFDEQLEQRRVRFESTTDDQGRDRAVNIVPAE